MDIGLWLQEVTRHFGGDFILQFGVAFVAGYVLPAFVAVARRHAKANTIIIASLFTGWTIIGWIACFLWALRGQSTQPRTSKQTRQPRGARTA